MKTPSCFEGVFLWLILTPKYKQMTLTEKVNNDVKAAMKAKDKVRLEAVRAIKSALLLAATEKGGGESDETAEIKMIQKLVKQRKDAADIFKQQGREDLMQAELEQMAILEEYLPEAISEDELVEIVKSAVESTNAESMKDMGKVMGLVNAKVAGRADGKLVADLVKKALA